MRRHDYKYYDGFLGAFVAILVLSNLIGVAKVVKIGQITFAASALFFPVSYVIGDVLTEVYGYSYARRAVWVGFGSLVFTAAMAYIVVHLPGAPGWHGQKAYEEIFDQTPRIVVASMIAFWSGEFANAFVLAQLKLRTQGRYLWTRTIGSTVVSQFLDSIIFFPLAFFGVWDLKLLLTVTVTNFLLKVAWEAICTPLTYFVVRSLKKAEAEDYFDHLTNFTPFKTQL
jgi:queuosine precursor transporter